MHGNRRNLVYYEMSRMRLIRAITDCLDPMCQTIDRHWWIDAG